MSRILHFYYDWTSLNDKQFPRIVREFLDNGADHFVITEDLLLQMIENPERKDFLHKICKDMNVHFSTVHALFGPKWDLNIPNPADREKMLRHQKKGMQISREFGCVTYTIHVGAYHYCYDRIPLETLRPLAHQALETLIPEAEKLGMIIAVENSFEMPNSAKEVIGLTDPFMSSPAIGLCYDTGHANCMASAPWKKMEEYAPYFPVCWWENGVIPEDGALEKMKDRIVTCHIHDNNGYADLHDMPGDGTIDWNALVPELKSCPNMKEYQTEVGLVGGRNWAGVSAAPAGGYSIRRLVDTFRKLGF